MLDVKVIRNDPDKIKAAMKTRNMDADSLVDSILKIDEERRRITGETEAMKAEQNADNKKIPVLKKEGKDTAELMDRLKTLSDAIKKEAAQLSALEEQQRTLLLALPNVPNPDVPIGKDDTENREIRRWREPTEFSFDPKPHWDIGRDLDILDPETAEIGRAHV